MGGESVGSSASDSTLSRAKLAKRRMAARGHSPSSRQLAPQPCDRGGARGRPAPPRAPNSRERSAPASILLLSRSATLRPTPPPRSIASPLPPFFRSRWIEIEKSTASGDPMVSDRRPSAKLFRRDRAGPDFDPSWFRQVRAKPLTGHFRSGYAIWVTFRSGDQSLRFLLPATSLSLDGSSQIDRSVRVITQASRCGRLPAFVSGRGGPRGDEVDDPERGPSAVGRAMAEQEGA